MEPASEVTEILRRIEANQREQLAQQKHALDIQQQQFDMARRQFERAEKLQDRAERLQESGAAMMGLARKSLVIVLPVVIVLIIYLTWLIFR
ncbi:hypothetical protein [Elongatibacter sediminis]|uniref:Uncharacterized protein n=1 Tax=Elongatibacter sediminis TaxID=3119006 RepID=A0AAW9R7H6_9GAMM